MVMAFVFDPLLPGVCLHASCHTPPIVLFWCLLFIFRITLLFSLIFAPEG